MALTEIGRKRRRKPGNLAALQRTLWAGLLRIEDVLNDPNPDRAIRAAHALAALSGSYLKALELTDLEARVAALEAQLAQKEEPWHSDSAFPGSRIA